MEINTFLEKKNIETLWDVITDEDIFKFLSKDIQNVVSQIFLNNIKGFYDLEKSKNENLIVMNKKYIILILNYIKSHYPGKTPNKIKIHDQPVKELITYEEIQNDRKTIFDKELTIRQEEFTNAMTLKVPPVPDFSDKNNDTPINEMDKAIKEMTSKRKYDIEQINYNYQTDINSVNNWLKSQDTSIKTEKFTKKQDIQDTQNNNDKLKIFNQNATKKNVSWGENNEINEASYENENTNDENTNEEDIFKKLKKIESINKENIKVINKEENNLLENKIEKLEDEIKLVNLKIDQIIILLKQNR
jgi:hypothetical protein